MFEHKWFYLLLVLTVTTVVIVVTATWMNSPVYKLVILSVMNLIYQGIIFVVTLPKDGKPLASNFREVLANFKTYVLSKLGLVHLVLFMVVIPLSIYQSNPAVSFWATLMVANYGVFFISSFNCGPHSKKVN
ncbi:hypothetical protein ACVR1G_00295 [Streptococcus dentasini]